VEGFLYYCKDVSKDVKKSCENVICITNHFVPKDIGISKCIPFNMGDNNFWLCYHESHLHLLSPYVF